MLVVEAKLKNGTLEQYQKLDEAIRTSQFVRNSCVRYWMDNNNKETPWVNKLNSQARQSAADRAWQSISRFYQNCHAKIPGKKGFP
ncbi:MAG: transposase, partial [Microcystis sp. M_OC_Ca_00000000_C217Col]